MSRLTWDGMGLPNPSRETKFLRANADREIFIFPVQPTTCRIGNLTRLIHTPVAMSRTGNLTRLIHTLLYVMTIQTYIHTYGESGLKIGMAESQTVRGAQLDQKKVEAFALASYVVYYLYTSWSSYYCLSVDNY